MEYVFKPYVGSKYDAEDSVFSKRIMVVGASHYCEGITNKNPITQEIGEWCWNSKEKRCCPCNGCSGMFTQNVIRDYLDINIKSRWKQTFTKFFNALSCGCQIAKYDVVESLVFYNYLQTPEGKGAEDKHPEKFYREPIKSLNEKCFRSVIEDFKPDVIIVWGRNIRGCFQWDLFSGKGELIKDKRIALYKCKFDDRNLEICFIDHPSAMIFNQKNCARVFADMKFMKYCNS